jgi:hypothetical protein
MLMKFKIYYGDGSTYSDEDGLFEDAPYLNVMILATEDPDVGRELDFGARGEFYAWWPGKTKPWGFDRVGILDYLHEIGYPESTYLSDLSLEDFKKAGVKIGRSIDNHEFRSVLQMVNEDPYLQPKSAISQREAQI